jgi:SAM-dependent methyltransferase
VNDTSNSKEHSKDLLSDQVLEQSAIVANCQMNRERNLTGPNGYEKDLGFEPMDFLRDRSEAKGKVKWLDLCCGTGKALIEAAEVSDAEGLPVEIVGVDLVQMFHYSDSARLTLIQASLTNWEPEDQFDLITSVHGLHYIGDKLGLIARIRSWLTDTGRFVANFDVKSIKLPDGRSASRFAASDLRSAGFDYSFRKKLIQCDGRGERQVAFRYLGADDKAGPNYTGQPAVDSYERLSEPK